LSNSVDAAIVQTKTQAIINDIVKPRFAIAQASLDKTYLGPVTQAQYAAIAVPANVSLFVGKVDQAADEAAATPKNPNETFDQVLKSSPGALNRANDARDAVIKQTNTIAARMSECTQATVRIKAAGKKAGHPVCDPISTISETVNF
jgi:ABC-type nitrate/sulfonate/bicarbonate transport system substrate-binding protein